MLRIINICRKASKSSLRCIGTSNRCNEDDDPLPSNKSYRKRNARKKIDGFKKAGNKQADKLFINITNRSSSEKSVQASGEPSDTSKGDAGRRIHELIKSTDSLFAQPKKNVEIAKPTYKGPKGRQDEELVIKAAEKVAHELKGDTKKTKEELLNAYKVITVVKRSQKNDLVERNNLENIEAEDEGPTINIVEPKDRDSVTKTIDYVDKNHTSPTKEKVFKKTQILEGKVQFTLKPKQTLGIFGKNYLKEVPDDETLQFWKHLQKTELLEAGTCLPKNYFEEMMVLTKQGRVWEFPIDNEQGLDEEKEIDFTEHIFLEKHLEPWCPPFGPLRHFMDIVVKGLGRNCFLSIAEKKEHIMWFKDYFEKKKQILTELGLVEEKTPLEKQDAIEQD